MSNMMTYDQRLEGNEGGAMQISGGRVTEA